MGRNHYQHLPLTENLMETPRSSKDRYETKLRMRNALLNGFHLWRTIDDDLRQSIFEPIEGPDGTTREAEDGEIEEVHKLRQSLIGWLSLLYAGIEDMNNVHLAQLSKAEKEGAYPTTPHGTAPVYRDGESLVFDFEDLVAEAVEKVAWERGERVTEVTIETEPREDEPIGVLMERFESREPIDAMDLARLLRETELGADDLEGYYNDIASGSANVSWNTVDEQPGLEEE